jgi:hypothetical protein
VLVLKESKEQLVHKEHKVRKVSQGCKVQLEQRVHKVLRGFREFKDQLVLTVLMESVEQQAHLAHREV